MSKLLREWVASVLLLLVEGRVEAARAACMKAGLSAEGWDEMLRRQPAGSNNKYLVWCAKQFVNDALTSGAEGVDEVGSVTAITDAANEFARVLPRLAQRDINAYRNIDDVLDAVERAGEKHAGQAGASPAKVAAKARKVYVSDGLEVLEIADHPQACRYGKGTVWCVTNPSDDDWYSYVESPGAAAYFVMDKLQPARSAGSKFAVVIEPGWIDTQQDRDVTIWNAEDDMVKVATMVRSLGPERGRAVMKAIRADAPGVIARRENLQSSS